MCEKVKKKMQASTSVLACVVFKLIIYSIIIQSQLKIILCRKAGIYEISALAGPFLESPIIEELMVLVDDEGYNIVLQALFLRFLLQAYCHLA